MGTLPKQRPYSYSGLVKSSHDLDGNVKQELANFFNTVSDGEKVKITVECLGKASTATGFVWSYTKPHTYERITEQEYAELIESIISKERRTEVK